MSAMAPAKPASSTDKQQPFLRPVPRRRSEILLLKPVDIVWLIALSVLSCALVLIASLIKPIGPVDFLPYAGHAFTLPIGGAALATTAVGSYLAALRLKDRATAVITGLLVAASLTLAAGSAQSPLILLPAAIVVFALFAYAMGGTITALCLAGVAVFAHADMLLLGGALAIVAFCQRRHLAWAGAMAFLLLAGAACACWFTVWRPALAFWVPSTRGVTNGAGLAAVEPIGASLLPVLWFLFPYLAEWSQRSDRAKWWAPAVWLGIYLLAVIGISRRLPGGSLLPALPIIYLMASAGISRLLPAFAGEFARPLSRYLVATLSVGTLLAVRAAIEAPALYGHLP